MAWSTPLTAVSNATLTAAQWNASVRDNLLETGPAKATTTGRMLVVNGANSLVERAVGHDTVTASATTTSTTPVDLAGSTGPTVTIATGTTVMVTLSAFISNSAAGGIGQMTVAVSGASSIAASNDNSLYFESSAAGDLAQATYRFPLTGLNVGNNTFTAKYSVSAGTGTFLRRRLIVEPWG